MLTDTEFDALWLDFRERAYRSRMSELRGLIIEIDRPGILAREKISILTRAIRDRVKLASDAVVRRSLDQILESTTGAPRSIYGSEDLDIVIEMSGDESEDEASPRTVSLLRRQGVAEVLENIDSFAEMTSPPQPLKEL